MKIEGQLLEKLNNAGIEVEEITQEHYNSTTQKNETIISSIANFPCARENKRLIFSDKITIDTYINSHFERFKFIKDYEAIWSSELKVLECELQGIGSSIFENNTRFLYRRLANAFGANSEINDDIFERFEFEKSESNCLITIGGASIEYAILSCLKNNVFNFEISKRRITLRIENINISTHDQALKILERIGNSILFKLDLTSRVEMKLSEDREIRRGYQRRRKANNNLDKTFPIYEYDSEPMSLYWYAKSANGMPLLQFLAFYQILEFYFPIFSAKEAHQQIKNIIKDPRFNPNKDSDITRIIHTINPNKSQGFGSELEQLKSTIRNCISNEVLIEYINENQELIDFFKDKKSKKISSKTLNISNVNTDIIKECAERIYEIRCRVVHTKAADNDYDLLLPTSPELKYLSYDISILEVIAKNVLIATSRLLKL